MLHPGTLYGIILQAFIGEQSDLQTIANTYANAQIVTVGQNISIIPMTEELFDEINAETLSEDINAFMFLTGNVEQAILKIIGGRQIGYIEAEYSCGQGGQSAILWKDGRRLKMFAYGQNAINSVLKYLGIVTKRGRDEFDSINLGKHRDTSNWLES